ncbi:13479_t:CDS:2 [Funneliformis geosporum]|uniref:Gem-associated protein 2 n=1 Tax=Funneliformis geosporum TaxID=1117311 RepID=A0A9W4SCA6_9GLOM|nr:13479_t:CDS:2 [Funneliformis geosporum]CAI2164481.1 14454_t:CDS:2 [Funneliformis geosporum]
MEEHLLAEFEEDFYKDKEKDKDESESEVLIQKVLPVSEKPLPRDRPPATGEEYLRMVRLEAIKRPTVIKTKNPITQPKGIKVAKWVKRGWEYQTEYDNYDQNFVKKDWENRFLMKFDLIRQGLEKRVRKNFGPSRNKSSIELPARNDEAGWLKFCYGVNSIHESLNLAKDIGLENEGDIDEMTLPLVSVVSQMDQITTITLLSYHQKWISNGITIAQSQWLFALLARVDNLLMPNQMAILRQLSEKCIQLRQKVDEEDLIMFASLNIIITIVRKYFGQKDLS